MSDDDDALAAAWGAETEEDATAGDAEVEAASAGAALPSEPARILNQAEIDSLLGFGDVAGDDTGESGIQRIISSGLVSYERLPMLEIVFDRLVRIMSTSLQQFHFSDNVEVGD